MTTASARTPATTTRAASHSEAVQHQPLPNKTASQIKKALRKIKKHRDSIAKHRDALRDLMDDLSSLHGAVTEGVEHLDCAIDSLSEFA